MLAYVLLEERDALSFLLKTQRVLLAHLSDGPNGAGKEEAIERALAASNQFRQRVLDRDLEVLVLAGDRGLPAHTDLLGVVEMTAEPMWRSALKTILGVLECGAAEALDLSTRISEAGPCWSAVPIARVHPEVYRSGGSAGQVPLARRLVRP